MDQRTSRTAKALFGAPGLDDILNGGLARNRLYLMEGAPGSGKTTLGLQFLIEGANAGEKGLYITLSETEQELRETAASHNWSIPANIDIFELVPPESLLDDKQQQSLLYSSDLELGETTTRIFEVMERSKPSRLVLDSLSEIRLLAQNSLRYRRQILALKHYFAQRDVTVLLLDDLTADVLDKTVHSVAHGVARLEELTPEYGAERRRLRVLKYRGQPFRGGYHDFTIKTGGVQVFPRLVASEYRARRKSLLLSTDIPQLDKLMGGGIESGSSVPPALENRSWLFNFSQPRSSAASMPRCSHSMKKWDCFWPGQKRWELILKACAIKAISSSLKSMLRRSHPANSLIWFAKLLRRIIFAPSSLTASTATETQCRTNSI
jgi:KaiC/GvpD/RAD55 family RecA-like ATPase